MKADHRRTVNITDTLGTQAVRRTASVAPVTVQACKCNLASFSIHYDGSRAIHSGFHDIEHTTIVMTCRATLFIIRLR